jgi:hypothetical protein
MAIETSPAHQTQTTPSLIARPSALGTLSAVVLVATWTTLTVAHVGKLVATSSVAASPSRVADGRVWLLVTSGLLVQRPIVLSLVSFVVLAVLALVVCGPKVLWLGAIIGHVFSTVIAYGLLAVVRLADHTAYSSLLHAPDYGVSAVAAAWLGSIACTAWARRGSSLRGKAAVLLSCVAVALFAWMVQRHVQKHLTFLDSEHGFAFALGVLIVRNPWSIASRPRLTLLRKAPVADAESGRV